MKSSEIRKKFLEYFKEKGHKIMPSDSLIPSSDPTLLFTSAGMVQFKNYFSGAQKGLSRAATSQKCFRTTDIEKIGHTPRHLSFFEMLGNFSFGDYFKEEAINWAWEFLTEVVKLPKDKLYITVYEDDPEAFEIWGKIVPASRIYNLGEDTNFWKMGPTGPCGPCSEIIYDLGENLGCGKPGCDPGCDCARWLEVWNLVFTQFDRRQDGSLAPLPKKNIDTGMGLERLSMVVNSMTDIFETDLFQPIIARAAEMMNLGEATAAQLPALKKIADHSRAILFLMSDGITALNDGRGYVLRRIIRRAQRAGWLLGCEKPFLHKLLSKVVDIMSDAYPETLTHIDNIALLLKSEEEKFLETLGIGLKILDEMLEKNKKEKFLSGKDAFYLYETYGFPFDLTREICAERNVAVDEKGFAAAQDEARNLSRASWKGAESKETIVYKTIMDKTGKTDFVGYECLVTDSRILSVVKNGAAVEKISEGEEGEIILRKTPFYAESGGQTGDAGAITSKTKNARAEVVDTQKPVDGIITHKIKVIKGGFSVGDEVIAAVDEERRKDIARHHTATHLLHKSLREILGKGVVQAGSLVAPDYLRFDFTYSSGLNREELVEVEKSVNEAVRKNMPVCTSEEDIDSARKKGAMALFGEKYGKKVRAVSVGDTEGAQPFSLELCGGTHVKSTGEIGLFKIISQSSVGSNTRRITAVCGKYAEEYVYRLQQILDESAEILKTSANELPGKIQKVVQRQKSLERELERAKTSAPAIGDLSGKATEIKGVKFVSEVITDYNEKSVASLSDNIMTAIKSGVVLLVNKQNDRFSFTVSVSKDALEKRLSAREIANAFAAATGSSGGGKETFARGGGRDVSKIDEGIKAVKDFIAAKL